MLGFSKLAQKIFGSENDRKLKATRGLVDRISALEPVMEGLSDEDFPRRTETYKTRLNQGETLEDLLPEAFAAVREASRRTLGLRHFDVQMMGGIVLHQGKISEMKTGEGKTLVATLPVYLNALTGRGVHVVTVNDYLAKRDAEWMGQVYRFLGLSVGVIVPGLDDGQRRHAYSCDVTYATNNELGFDYLRDNMKYQLGAMSQRGHAFAIVDEVDSILIDEARTPLIISGPTQDQSELYVKVDAVIPRLTDEHFEVDEKQKTVVLTEDGTEFVEEVVREVGLLPEDGTLYDPTSVSLVHHVNQALRAHKMFAKDKDYIVRSNEVVIIDEFTGRMMAGRRYSDGLHQALEAKERVAIRPENVTMASVTFQNYFRLYDKLAGMTGTALTEAAEFQEIYGLDVVEIPTNRPIAREDEDDQVFRTTEERYRAVVAAIADGHRRGQPMLVGTTSIEKSEALSSMLSDAKFLGEVSAQLRADAESIGDNEKYREERDALIETAEHIEAQAAEKEPLPHKVLNARYHEQEAFIVAQAGRPGAITIATNMAGRGTDIQLGGNVEMAVASVLTEEVCAALDALVKGLPTNAVQIDAENALAGLTAEGRDIVEPKLREAKLMAPDSALADVLQNASLAVIARLLGQSLRAHFVFQKGRDYRVDAGEIVLSPQLMAALAGNRALADGLPQALAAKEGAQILPGAFSSALVSHLEEIDAERVTPIREKAGADIGDLKQTALDAGGLWVIATERHESRRIDNQLRGRSGRQGDPGRTTFYLSLQDDLMRIFGSERMDGMLRRLGLQEGEAIVHPWVNKAIERAQGKVEARNFDARKHVLKYDDVMNDQRRAIFEQRREIMEADDVQETVRDMRHTVIDDMVAQHIPERAYADQWDVDGLEEKVQRHLGAPLPVKDWAAEEGVDDETIRERLYEEADKLAAVKAVDIGKNHMRDIEKAVLLNTVDQHWREHLSTLEHLRSVIGLRGYGQRDPLNEYKREAFMLFEDLLSRLRGDVVGQLMNLQLAPPEQQAAEPGQGLRATSVNVTLGPTPAAADGSEPASEAEPKAPEPAEASAEAAPAQSTGNRSARRKSGKRSRGRR